MTSWFLACINAAVAALLARAAAEKFVRPDVAASAIAEIWPGRSHIRQAAIRGVAGIEAVAAISVAIPLLRLPGQGLICALGAAFVSMGIVGLARGSTEPCGCFGTSGKHPLGAVSIVLGLVLMADTALNFAMAPQASATGLSVRSAGLAAIALMAWLHVAHRAAARAAIRNLLRRAEAPV